MTSRPRTPRCIYWDTSALVRKLYRNKHRSWINGLFRGSGHVNYASELTVLEVASALACRVRDKEIDAVAYDRARRQFMEDIANRRVTLVTFDQRVMIDALQLIDYVGVSHGKSLKTNDACHIRSARDLAMRSKSKVVFVTMDETLSKIALTVPYVSEHLIVRYRHP